MDNELLARINRRLSILRRWLGHDHNDDAFWAHTETTARAAQAERVWLRPVAHWLHVERATARGRLHGACFDSFEQQRTWLDDNRESTQRRAQRL